MTNVATKWGMGGGTLSSVYGWVASNEAVILIGLFVTIAGFVINLIYQRKRDRREADEAELRKKLQEAEDRRREELHKAQMKAYLQPHVDTLT